MANRVIHHIELSHTSPHISGGEKALVEIVRYLNNFDNIEQIIYTSESGREVYKQHLGEIAEKISFVTIGSKRIEKIHDYLAYYLRVLQILSKIVKFSNKKTNIIFSHEEFLPTSLYSWILKKINRRARWIIFFHMKCPSIWRGFEGEYTGKFKVPSVRILRYKIEQWLFFVLTKKNVEKVVTVNSCYVDFLENIYGSDGLVYPIKRYSGVKVPEKKVPFSEKKFDLCFMARFHEQKGVFELIDILKRLKKSYRRDINLALIGGGVPRVEKKFFHLVKKNNLSKNIKYFGYITGDKKFDILASSKVFVFPSYYESFGQVILESMKVGLPAVVYDLQPFHFFEKGVIKSPVLDNENMVGSIVRLLTDEKYYEKVQEEAIEFASDFSWDKTGKEIKEIINQII